MELSSDSMSDILGEIELKATTLTEMWDEIGLTQEEKDEEIRKMNENLQRVKAEFIAQTRERCQKIEEEIESIKSEHIKMLESLGAAPSDIEVVRQSGCCGTIKTRHEEVESNLYKFKIVVYNKRYNEFAQYQKQIDFAFSQIGIQDKDKREPFAEIDTNDLSYERLTEYQNKAEALNSEVLARSKRFDEMIDEIKSLSRDIQEPIPKNVAQIIRSRIFSDSNFAQLMKSKDDFQRICEMRTKRISEMGVEINKLWDLLRIDEAERKQWLQTHNTLSQKNVEDCIYEAERLTKLRNENIDEIIDMLKLEINGICRDLHCSKEQEAAIYYKCETGEEPEKGQAITIESLMTEARKDREERRRAKKQAREAKEKQEEPEQESTKDDAVEHANAPIEEFEGKENEAEPAINEEIAEEKDEEKTEKVEDEPENVEEEKTEEAQEGSIEEKTENVEDMAKEEKGEEVLEDKAEEEKAENAEDKAEEEKAEDVQEDKAEEEKAEDVQEDKAEEEKNENVEEEKAEEVQEGKIEDEKTENVEDNTEEEKAEEIEDDKAEEEKTENVEGAEAENAEDAKTEPAEEENAEEERTEKVEEKINDEEEEKDEQAEEEDTPELVKDDVSDDSSSSHDYLEKRIEVFMRYDAERIRLKQFHAEAGPILELIRKREDIIEDYEEHISARRKKTKNRKDADRQRTVDYNQMKDTDALSQATSACDDIQSQQTHQQIVMERAHRRYKVVLPRTERRLKMMLMRYEKENGEHFLWDGKPMIDQLGHVQLSQVDVCMEQKKTAMSQTCRRNLADGASFSSTMKRQSVMPVRVNDDVMTRTSYAKTRKSTVPTRTKGVKY